MTRGTYKSEYPSGLQQKHVKADATVTTDATDTTDANVTNSLTFGSANQLYRRPPDPCGSYQHSFRAQPQEIQPVVVRAEQ
jgi:hypothetical protein